MSFLVRKVELDGCKDREISTARTSALQVIGEPHVSKLLVRMYVQGWPVSHALRRTAETASCEVLVFQEFPEYHRK